MITQSFLDRWRWRSGFFLDLDFTIFRFRLRLRQPRDQPVIALNLTLRSAQSTRSFLPFRVMPSFRILLYADSASSFIEKETYPTPFETPVPCSVITKAERTGAISEKRVWRSTEVAVKGRFETKSVDLT